MVLRAGMLMPAARVAVANTTLMMPASHEADLMSLSVASPSNMCSYMSAEMGTGSRSSKHA